MTESARPFERGAGEFVRMSVYVVVWCSLLQCVLQCATWCTLAAVCSLLHVGIAACVAVCCSVLQCVAVCVVVCNMVHVGCSVQRSARWNC